MLTRMYRDYERKILWQVNNIEDKAHGERCKNTRPGQWCNCRTKADEIHEWEDWAIENFGKTWEEIRWEIPESVIAKI